MQECEINQDIMCRSAKSTKRVEIDEGEQSTMGASTPCPRLIQYSRTLLHALEACREERGGGRGLPCRVKGIGYRVWGLGFRVWGLGFEVYGLPFTI